MTYARHRLGIAVVATFMVAHAHAGASEPESAGEDCGLLCQLSDYLNTDHMVVRDPAPPTLPVEKVRVSHHGKAKPRRDGEKAGHPGTAASSAPAAPSHPVAAARQTAPHPPLVASSVRPAAIERPTGPPDHRLRADNALPAPSAQSAPETVRRPARAAALIPGSAPSLAAAFQPATGD